VVSHRHPCRPSVHHRANDPDCLDLLAPPVNQVTHEDRLTLRMLERAMVFSIPKLLSTPIDTD
jgi:hypothetical protein